MSAQEEDIYVLSPFEIQASQEDGYLATSTFAGTRVNTPLEDLGASISVHTQQFMEDLGVTDIETLLVYSLNAEIGGFRGNFINADSQGIENKDLLEPHNNNRIRGLTSADITTQYFRTDIPWDSYNTRRIDVQRGANSVLFGLGSPSGIINVTPTEAEIDDFGSLSLQL